MDKKIYVLGNLFFVVDVATGNIDVQIFASDARITRPTEAGSTEYTFGGKGVTPFTLSFVNIKDKDGGAYPSAIAWEDYYSCKTGFNSASGGSGAGMGIKGTDSSVGTTAILQTPTPVEVDTISAIDLCSFLEWVDIGGTPSTFNTIKMVATGLIHVKAFYQLDRTSGALNNVYFALREVDNVGAEIEKIPDSIRVDKVNNTGLDGVGLDFMSKVEASPSAPRYFQIMAWASGTGNVFQVFSADGYTDSKVVINAHID